MVDELRRIVEESEIMREDDAKWPKKNATGRQELEVRLGKEHISFEVSTFLPPFLDRVCCEKQRY